MARIRHNKEQGGKSLQTKGTAQPEESNGTKSKFWAVGLCLLQKNYPGNKTGRQLRTTCGGPQMLCQGTRVLQAVCMYRSYFWRKGMTRSDLVIGENWSCLRKPFSGQMEKWYWLTYSGLQGLMADKNENSRMTCGVICYILQDQF